MWILINRKLRFKFDPQGKKEKKKTNKKSFLPPLNFYCSIIWDKCIYKCKLISIFLEIKKIQEYNEIWQNLNLSGSFYFIYLFIFKSKCYFILFVIKVKKFLTKIVKIMFLFLFENKIKLSEKNSLSFKLEILIANRLFSKLIDVYASCTPLHLNKALFWGDFLFLKVVPLAFKLYLINSVVLSLLFAALALYFR